MMTHYRINTNGSYYTHTHICLTASIPGQPGQALSWYHNENHYGS